MTYPGSTGSRRRAELALVALALAAAGAVLWPLVVPDRPWPARARDLLAARGQEETGATNLVSAIYLGYRAFDTLGETVVLLAALAGSIALIGAHGASGEPGRGHEEPDGGEALGSTAGGGPGRLRHRHTEIMDVIAGKLGPVVLLFGAYVMAFGHSSPGGGFQGGVVLASGVAFIALGRRAGGIGRLEPGLGILTQGSLARIEAAAFAAMVALSFPGTIAALEAVRTAGGGEAFPAVSSIIAFNVVIGLKVGAGVALMCVMMLGGEEP